MHVALLTDFPVVAFANGVSLATRSLKRHLELRGHRVTLVGPRPAKDNPQASPDAVLLESAPFLAHPGVNLAFAWPPSAFDNEGRGFDVVHSQANSLLIHWAPIMRALHRVPCISTHTLYTPGFVHHALPKALTHNTAVRDFVAKGPARAVDHLLAQGYNGGDGLIVQCEGLARYWRQMGLTVPLHVIPRPIDPALFEAPLGPDPFRADFVRGKRVICVARHAKEKRIDLLLQAFAKWVLPKHPDASLTIVGNGQEHQALIALAETLGIAARCDFPGEKPQKDLRHYYGHADLFGFASTTETYGQVIAEALWCGLGVAAIDDGMGVAFQVEHERNGHLVRAGVGEEQRLGESIAELLADPARRRALAKNGAQRARKRVAPDVVYKQYEDAYAAAHDHLRAHPPTPFSRHSLTSWARLFGRHLAPWTVQQMTLFSLGALGGAGNSYKLPSAGIGDLPSESDVPVARRVAPPRRRAVGGVPEAAPLPETTS